MVSSRQAKEPAKLTYFACTKQSWLHGAKLASSLIALLLIIVPLAIPTDALAPSKASIGDLDGPPKRSASSSQASGAELMVHEREFVSPQVKIQIECQRDKTVIKVNFSKPFNGTLGAGKLDTTQCKLVGNGTRQYEIQVKHNSSNCDTQWDSANSSIFNTLFVRFHPSLETGSDLAKNVMCRLTVGDLVVGRRPLKTSSKVSLLQPSSPNQQTDLAPKNAAEPSNSASKIESLSSEVDIGTLA